MPVQDRQIAEGRRPSASGSRSIGGYHGAADRIGRTSAFNEGVRQFDQTYGAEEADLTGWVRGQETLCGEQGAREYEQAQQQFGLQQEHRTGVPGRQMLEGCRDVRPRTRADDLVRPIQPSSG